MKPLGPLGEDIGARYLRRKGFRVIRRNYTCVAGEIDIVAGDGDTLVFVEVKTRRSDNATDPEAAVNAHKRGQLTRAAKFFIAESRAQRVPCRFDVLAILVPPDGKPEVTHFVNAFTPTTK